MSALPKSTVEYLRRKRGNAFERHGIDHLSPSSLNAWIASPALWVMERLLDRRAPVGCAAYRGTAVEAGVSHGLFEGGDLKSCLAVALTKYDELAAYSTDPKKETERDGIAGMIQQGLLALRPKGVPSKPFEGNQHRVEITLEGVPVPVIGFLDFEWPGDVVDTKTTFRVPSAISDSHRRQAAVYQHARSNSAVTFLYMSDKRAQGHTLTREDYLEGLSELTHTARRLERFLGLSNDAHELAQLVTPDFSTFYWNSSEARELGRQTYGF